MEKALWLVCKRNNVPYGFRRWFCKRVMMYARAYIFDFRSYYYCFVCNHHYYEREGHEKVSNLHSRVMLDIFHFVEDAHIGATNATPRLHRRGNGDPTWRYIQNL